MNTFQKSQAAKMLACYVTPEELGDIEKAIAVGTINKYGKQKQPDGSWKYVGKGKKNSPPQAQESTQVEQGSEEQWWKDDALVAPVLKALKKYPDLQISEVNVFGGDNYEHYQISFKGSEYSTTNKSVVLDVSAYESEEPSYSVTFVSPDEVDEWSDEADDYVVIGTNYVQVETKSSPTPVEPLKTYKKFENASKRELQKNEEKAGLYIHGIEYVEKI
mgnify:CR=1 FL=1